MPKYIKGKNGKMAGSIGDGKTRTPQAAPQIPVSHALFTGTALQPQIPVEWHLPRSGTVLLGGVVGSVAYGLDTPQSDRDRLGLFAAPTAALVGLTPVEESYVTHEPSDVTVHEARKFVTLAMAANPTITELLWLTDLNDRHGAPLHEVTHPLGVDLVALRVRLLSAGRVRDAYLGYATAQFKRLEGRYDGTAPEDARRIRKHALHMARLVQQGYSLYTTGDFSPRVTDPGWFHEFSRATPEVWKAWFEQERAKFNAADRSALPAQPDTDAASRWLATVRDTFWTPGSR